MKKEKLKIGLMPTRRLVFNWRTARDEYEIIMPIIRAQMPDYVEFVDVDDICEHGMGCSQQDVEKVVEKFTAAKVDALFFPFCDFGEESCVVGVAKAFKLPTLIWGSRDKLSTYEHREKETQCGIFAAAKVLRNYGVTFSYIWNCEADSPDLVTGFEKFTRVASVLKALRNLNVAEIGDRPAGFYSVIHNQLQLIQNFNITVKPIGLAAIAARSSKIKGENGKELTDYVADLKSRIDCSELENDDYVVGVAAGTLAIEQLMNENGCKCAAFDCGGVRMALGLQGSACAIEGELADRGLPTACECDVWGAITALLGQAVSLGDETPFLADWTYRHPTNNNSELIWHGGPFAYSLARKDVKPEYKKRVTPWGVSYEAHWELKPGPITMFRMDELDGGYYLFCGEGKSCEGPDTTGTFVWLEVDSWKRWEEKLVLGPYIHHVGGVYGNYFEIFREVAKYLHAPKKGIHLTFDHPGREGDYSL
ncbi:MAG: fucose isomerase [Christensenellaceae bacterium]|jgi:L-fucose isomerase-like protein|nr:fucose isomerase [Christensenellaceae bacterium]